MADEQKQHEQVAILRQRIFLKRLPKDFDDPIDRSTENVRTMLSSSILNRDYRATLVSHCSKSVTQFKFELMTVTLATAEEIGKSHAQIAINTKQQLSSLDGDRQQLRTEAFLHAIEVREATMRERAEQLLKHKLTSFFEQAPTTADD